MPKTKSPPTIDGFVTRDEIDFQELSYRELILDEQEHVHCYLGYRQEIQPWAIEYYALPVADNDTDARTSHRFVELTRGTIHSSCFLSPIGRYKLMPDHRLALPTSLHCDFGVIDQDGEAEDFTRQIFGGTFEELENATRVLGWITGRRDMYFKPPRLTFSKNRNNRCDLTGCLIPERFPFIAFADTVNHWGHVSIHGLLKLLAFHGNPQGDVFGQLIGAGLPEDVLRRLISCGEGHYTPLRSVNER